MISLRPARAALLAGVLCVAAAGDARATSCVRVDAEVAELAPMSAAINGAPAALPPGYSGARIVIWAYPNGELRLTAERGGHWLWEETYAPAP